MKRPSPRHDPYLALRVPAFRALLIGGVLVHLGTSGQALAIGYEMYDRTDDPMALGMVGLVQAIPMLLLTLPAGYLADILDRRKLMIISMILTSLTSLALALFSYAQWPVSVMYVLLFLDSCALRLGMPARSSLIPLLVPRELLENAFKWRTSLGQISSMLGPLLGALIILWSVPAAYVISALSTIMFIFLIASLDIPPATRAAPGRMLQQVAEGIRFVWNKKVLLATSSLDMFAVLLGGAVYLLPVYASDIIDLDGLGLSSKEALGFLRAAPAAGAMVTALLLTHLPPMRRAGRTMLLAVAGFGAATIVFGLSRNFWLSMVMLALTGAFDNISVVVRHTLVQLATPNEMRGRVSAVNSIFISSSNELGGFESGTVAHFFGPVISVVSGGIGTIAIVLAWMGIFPSLRKVKRLADTEAGILPDPAAPSADAAPLAATKDD